MNSMRKKTFIIKVSQNAIEKSFLGGNFECKFSTFLLVTTAWFRVQFGKKNMNSFFKNDVYEKIRYEAYHIYSGS